MTEDELFAEIELDRVRNNQLFMDWLRMSYRCPNCREAAKAYHRKIWEYDQSICQATATLAAERTDPGVRAQDVLRRRFDYQEKP